MKAVWNDITIAQSDDTIVVEGNHYFPPESIDDSMLRKTKMKSLCVWKGLASYYHLEMGDQVNRYAAWTYHHPYPWIRKIRNRIAFWNGIEVVPD